MIHRGRLGRLGPVAIGAALCCASALAHAQDTRELTDQGQWQRQVDHPLDTPEGKIQTMRRLIAEGKGNRARKMATRWIKDYPAHEQLPQAHLLRADARVAERDYYKSLFDYELLIRIYPGSQYFHLALEREYEIANLFANGMKRKMWGMRFFPFGQEADFEAEEILIRIQERAPGSELGEKASLRLADFYYDTAEMYKATDAYELFLENYPTSRHRQRAMRRLIQSGLATFKGPQFDPTGLLDAATRLRQYRNEFPAASEQLGADALLIRIEESLALKSYFHGEWYERRNKPVSAIYIYRRVMHDYPKTAAAQQAMLRLRELDPQMSKFSGRVERPASRQPPAPEDVTIPRQGDEADKQPDGADRPVPRSDEDPS